MAAPASEEVRELERLLVIAADSGEPVAFAKLQEELGMGHGDLEAALDVLRAHGKASEVAPGEWSGGEGLSAVEADEGEPEPVRVSVGEGEGEAPATADEIAARAEALAARDGAPAEHLAQGWGSIGAEPTVRLTFAIASTLTAEVLGALVKAGIDDAATREDETFVLEVVP